MQIQLTPSDVVALGRAQKATSAVRELAEKVLAWCDEPEIPDSWIEKIPTEVRRFVPTGVNMASMAGLGKLPPFIAALVAIEKVHEKILTAHVEQG